MKVLHVVYNCHPDETGGAIRTRYVVEAQARLGVQPVVLSSPFQPPASEACPLGLEHWNGIPYYRCYNGHPAARFMAAKPWWERAAKMRALIAFARRIRQVALEEQVDLIHAHSLFFCGLAAELAARRLGLPVVYEVRSLIEEGMEGAGARLRFAYRWFDRLTCRLASHVIVLCEGLRAEMIRRGVPSYKITVAGNGVDLHTHAPAETGGPAPGQFTVGYIGTLARYEGLDLLLDAAALLAQGCPELRVLIAGEGPARPALEQQARRLGLDAVVRFTGRIPHDQVASCYGAVDLFVLPRRRERITDLVAPLKPLEIMAYGKPLLASDCGGHRELILDRVNGALFQASSATDLARRIRDLKQQPEFLARLGCQARAWAYRNRSWEYQCRPVVELYRRLVVCGQAAKSSVLLVAPAPHATPTGGVETGVGMILRSALAERHRIRVWDRRQGRRFARFAAYLVFQRPRTVHIKSSAGVNFVESAIYALMGRALGYRVLFQLHSGDFEAWYGRQSAGGRWAVRQVLRWPSQLLVLSEYWRRLLERLAPGRPIAVVPNGVEIPELPLKRPPRAGPLRVLTIATLGRHKGYFEILAAAARLREHSLRFILAGPDEASGRGEGEAVRRRAAELALDGAVEFTGPVSPPRKWEALLGADIFLLPSHAEGMPNAVLEAMAAGLPVIATAVGALPEMLGNGRGARFVEVANSEDLVQALLELSNDPCRRAAMGQWNRAQVEDHYSFARVERLLGGLYGGELARAAAAARST